MEANIQIIAEEKIKKIVEDGTLETLIEKQLIKTTESIVQDIFRDYSDFGKELKRVLTEKLQLNLNELNISTYTGIVVRTIEDNISEILEGQKSKILEAVKNVTGVIEKTNWKLSEIVAIYRKNLTDNPEVVLEIEKTSYGHTWIRIGEKKEKSYGSYSSSTQHYEVKMIIDTKKKTIDNVWYSDYLIDARKTKVYKHSIENFLLKLWVNECVLEVDEDDADYEATKECED